MKKRSDLQGIRGVAITSVLLYHFYPELFKNGYVGVDQFFILSGFLMAEILSRDVSITFSTLLDFYYRRMKRIMPLYALFIFATLAITLMVFDFQFFSYNVSYALRSLAFISNILMESDSPSYEEMLANAQVLLTHTWSLSCEVQFYLIAPFLMLMPSTHWKTQVLSSIGIASYLSFTYSLEHGKSEFAFNSMLTRIWQFVAGSLCSVVYGKANKSTDEFKPLLSEDDHTNDKECESTKLNQINLSVLSNIACFSMLVLCWFPIEITSHLVRLLVCIQTTGLISSGQEFPNKLLSNRLIVYLGDVSYSLYLIHWPVCVFLKQYQLTSVFATASGILSCILLAALVFETYEQFYLKLERAAIIGLTGFLYFGCVLLILAFSSQSIFKQQAVSGVIHPDAIIPENLTVEEAIDWNNKFASMDVSLINIKGCSIPQWGKLCTINNTDFSGSKRMMLIGNSFAPNIARMFIRLNECQLKAKEIQMFTLMGCEVLENTGDWAAQCKNLTEKFQAAVRNVKPDILFIITRQVTSMRPFTGTVDTILNTEKELLARMEKNVNDKVYILNAVPEHIGGSFTSSINNGLKTGKKVSQEFLRSKTTNYALARRRMELLSKHCSKCELIDVTPAFTKSGTFQFYDEDNGLEHFVTTQHFSQYGLQKMSGDNYRPLLNLLFIWKCPPEVPKIYDRRAQTFRYLGNRFVINVIEYQS